MFVVKNKLFDRYIKIKFYSGRMQIYKISFLDFLFKRYRLPENEAFMFINGRYETLNLHLKNNISTPIYDSFYVKEKIREIKKKQEAMINNNWPQLYFEILDNGQWLHFKDIEEVNPHTTSSFNLIVRKNQKEKELIFLPKIKIIRTNYYDLVLHYDESDFVIWG